ncbi:uncharacterized protein LOC106177491 [Lingula anatina]|uniref:Uncharacterized protein LOC106177491 n=1 Tax=Lingula anatina TaxID=7574 RepID=A0A1S3JZM1_LINAN|nr:uncharacterized protein LOC106177491 [Lingula anatina]|eukprot:XP_013415732.1 uncharacterized protein LOC106177491 [Lingula anatina]
MGCGSSANSVQATPALVIVGGEEQIGEDWTRSTKIEVYRLLGCTFLKSFDLPGKNGHNLIGGYSVSGHSSKPLIFITGGYYKEDKEPTQEFWKINLSQSPNESYMEQLPDMPVAMKDHKSCILTSDNEAFLYIVGNKNISLRFNFSSETWEHLPKLPEEMAIIQGLHYVAGILYCMGGGSMYSHKPSEGIKGSWNMCIDDNSFPHGLTADAAGKIYTFATGKSLHEFEPQSRLLSKVCDINPLDIQGHGAMVGFGDRTNSYLYFTGEHKKDTKVDVNRVIEFDLEMHRAVVAGYLKHKNHGHIGLIVLM